ncbi:Type-4 uracil-DNA glycosylase [Gammaproteobacteria bacterium]|nr:Type-4 uracil-DNA glycosylase [Gammaproteobacteria bacterium]
MRGCRGRNTRRNGEPVSARPARTARQQEVLRALGIEVWQRREPAPDTADRRLTDAEPPDWAALRAAVRDCRRCELHRSRTQTVFGVGDESAAWMIVGEAPGAEEDRQGEPFVGPAGQLLNEMLRAAGASREQVFIANILKCRPPDNRDPQPEEAAACADHLAAQIHLVAPRLILAVGRIAAQNLLGQDLPVGRLRGRVHSWGPAGIPLVVTYHPAYLLRSPMEKRKAWDDLRLALSVAPPVRS